MSELRRHGAFSPGGWRPRWLWPELVANWWFLFATKVPHSGLRGLRPGGMVCAFRVSRQDKGKILTRAMTLSKEILLCASAEQSVRVAPFREDFTTDCTDSTDGKEKKSFGKQNCISVKSVKSVVPFFWLRLAALRLCVRSLYHRIAAMLHNRKNPA